MTTEKNDKLNRIEEAARNIRDNRNPRVQLRRFASTNRQPRSSSVQSEEKRSADQVMYFEIITADHESVRNGSRQPDDLLVQLLKTAVNEAEITRRYLYQFVGEGEGMLFQNVNQVYNLDYGLRHRSMITIECAQRWLTMIGKELVINFVDAPLNG